MSCSSLQRNAGFSKGKLGTLRTRDFRSFTHARRWRVKTHYYFKNQTLERLSSRASSNECLFHAVITGTALSAGSSSSSSWGGRRAPGAGRRRRRDPGSVSRAGCPWCGRPRSASRCWRSRSGGLWRGSASAAAAPRPRSSGAATRNPDPGRSCRARAAALWSKCRSRVSSSFSLSASEVAVCPGNNNRVKHELKWRVFGPSYVKKTKTSWLRVPS